jgi:Ribbon-helix-helix protein, copG family
MADLLIRDVPDDVIAAIDADAKRLGLSRSEHLRRTLARISNKPAGRVTVDDFRRFSAVFADLADEEAMRGAWE